MDRIYHETGTHPWCQPGTAGALFEESEPGDPAQSAQPRGEAARYARPHP